ncbi:MAG: pyridoxal phosphate-dependent aminotransferase [Acidimicrobiia bacterium]
MNRLSAAITALRESSTMAITARARELRESGEDVIGFGAGEPDFATPDHVVAAAAAACADPAQHHYTAVGGHPRLREAIAARTLELSGLDYAPSQVLVTNGAKHAVANTFAALCGPGTEVLVPAPYWVTYPEIVRYCGATPVTVTPAPAQGFKVGVDDLEAARTEATKALLFVSPSNPTGAVYDRDEARSIAAWAAESGIWVVTDEIYGRLVYGAAEFVSLPAQDPDLAARSVVIDGVSKAYAMTGWRVGWMCGPPDVIEAASRLQGHQTSNVANVCQAAAIAALEGPQQVVEDMRLAFDARRRLMHSMLAAMDGVDCAEPAGAFYCFPDVEGLYGRRVAGRTIGSSADVAAALLEGARIAVVPGEGFGAPGHLRISYAVADEQIAAGMQRMGDLLSV